MCSTGQDTKLKEWPNQHLLKVNVPSTCKDTFNKASQQVSNDTQSEHWPCAGMGSTILLDTDLVQVLVLPFD